MNTFQVRIIGYQVYLIETFRYWFLSHFPSFDEVNVIILSKESSDIPPFTGVSLLVLFTESEIDCARNIANQYILIYHSSLMNYLHLFNNEKYPLKECMTFLDKKFLTHYRGEDDISSSFTKREREVLELFARGMSVKEVAYSLQISKYTVATHQRNLYLKTNSHSLQQLTLFASMEYRRT